MERRSNWRKGTRVGVAMDHVEIFYVYTVEQYDEMQKTMAADRDRVAISCGTPAIQNSCSNSPNPVAARTGCRRATCRSGRSRNCCRLARLPPRPLPCPNFSEPQVVRHFANLSQLNMSVDTHFYPLGSCTMKYNPKRNERVARMPGFADVHPYQPEATLQGMLQVLYELQEYLKEISGLAACSLQPAAGAHGELTALWVAAAYFRDESRKNSGSARRSSCPIAPTARTPPAPRWPASKRSP